MAKPPRYFRYSADIRLRGSNVCSSSDCRCSRWHWLKCLCLLLALQVWCACGCANNEPLSVIYSSHYCEHVRMQRGNARQRTNCSVHAFATGIHFCFQPAIFFRFNFNELMALSLGQNLPKYGHFAT
jgi:hypothetical protein